MEKAQQTGLVVVPSFNEKEIWFFDVLAGERYIVLLSKGMRPKKVSKLWINYRSQFNRHNNVRKNVGRLIERIRVAECAPNYWHEWMKLLEERRPLIHSVIERFVQREQLAFTLEEKVPEYESVFVPLGEQQRKIIKELRKAAHPFSIETRSSERSGTIGWKVLFPKKMKDECGKRKFVLRNRAANIDARFIGIREQLLLFLEHYLKFERNTSIAKETRFVYEQLKQLFEWNSDYEGEDSFEDYVEKKAKYLLSLDQKAMMESLQTLPRKEERGAEA